jgi:uncharacterized protein YegL
MPELAERPGGRLGPRRDVHFFWILDGSTSMKGEKIQSLNFAVASAIPEMRKVAAKHPHANVVVRVLKFATNVEWIVSKPTAISEFQWRDIEANGETSMGLALSAVCDELDKFDTSRRYLPPALILVTDGYPTDPNNGFEIALKRLLSHKLGRIATRLAIAIGTDVGPEGMLCLRKFINDPKIRPLEVSDLGALPRLMRIVSRSAIEISSTPSAGAASKALEAVNDADDWTWDPDKPAAR